MPDKRTAPNRKSSDEPVAFEKAVAELRQIVGKLESGETPLEESLALYERGVTTYRVCRQILDRAEKRIQVLVRQLDGTLLATDVEDVDEIGEAQPFAEDEE